MLSFSSCAEFFIELPDFGVFGRVSMTVSFSLSIAEASETKHLT